MKIKDNQMLNYYFTQNNRVGILTVDGVIYKNAPIQHIPVKYYEKVMGNLSIMAVKLNHDVVEITNEGGQLYAVYYL